MFQQVPVGPDESSLIRALQRRAEELDGRATALAAKIVPRPAPGQYQGVVEEVQRFVSAMGGLERIHNLLRRLQVGHFVWLVCLQVYGQHVYVRCLCQ